MTRLGQAGYLSRVIRNVGWLLSGKLLAALLSLVYLGLAARVLGLEEFGLFALILAYAQAIGNFSQFQSWQVVIRFGALHLRDIKNERFERLIAFNIWLDLTGAIASAGLGFFMAGLAGELLGWSDDATWVTSFFSLTLVFSIRATPTGVLRLLDRFDQLTLAESVTPIIRFAGAVVAAIWMPNIFGFLVAWAISEIVTSIVLWIMAAKALRSFGIALRIQWPTGVRSENDGLWRFACTSNATASVNLVWQQLGTLAVGSAVSASAAGIYRIAFQIAQGLSKPAQMLGRVVYPEFARLEGYSDFKRTVWRSTAAAGVAGVVMVAMTAIAGEEVLTLIAGAEYAKAAPVLLILSVAAAIDLFGFAIEPALLAAGYAGRALIARAAAAVVYIVCLLIALNEWGVYGAAFAAVAGSVIASFLSVFFLYRIGSKQRRLPASPDDHVE